MNKLILFLSLFLPLGSFAQQKAPDAQTYTRMELDLKLQLQQQEINQMRNEIKSYKERVSNDIQKQDKFIDEHHKYISNQMAMVGWCIAFMGIGVAIAIAGITWFMSWKAKNNLKEMKDEFVQIKKLKQEMEKKCDEMMDYLEKKKIRLIR